MKKIILFILMFCSFSYVAAFDKVWNSGFDEPVDYIFLSQSEKNLKIKGGTRSEFPAVALSISDFSDATATLTAVAMKGPISMINIVASGFTHFDDNPLDSYLIQYPYPSINDGGAFFGQARTRHDAGGYTSASVISADYTNDTNATTSNNEINAYLQTVLFKPIEKAGYSSFTDNTYEKSLKNDAVYYTSASNTDANDTALTATLIKNIETTYFSFSYNIDEKSLKNDVIYYTSASNTDANEDGNATDAMYNANNRNKIKIRTMNTGVFAHSSFMIKSEKDPSFAGFNTDSRQASKTYISGFWV